MNELGRGVEQRERMTQKEGEKYKAQWEIEVSSVINSRDGAISCSVREPTAYPGSFCTDTPVSILKA